MQPEVIEHVVFTWCAAILAGMVNAYIVVTVALYVAERALKAVRRFLDVKDGMEDE